MDPTAPSFSPAAPRPRGALIAIEGLDRAGKSTQVSLLAQRLSAAGHPAIVYKFPDRTTPTGTIINAYLTAASPVHLRAIHLLFSANRWEAVPALLAALRAGTSVVLDRYAYSGIAFSVAKGLDYAWCRAPDVGLPRPDAVLFLDVDPQRAAEREGFGGEVYEKVELQRKVREVFLRLREEEGGERGEGGKEGEGEESGEGWTVLDAGRDVGEVAEDVWRAAEKAVAWAGKHDVREIVP